MLLKGYQDEALDMLLLERYIDGGHSKTLVGTVTIAWHAGAHGPSTRALANLALIAAATGPYLWAECGQLLAHVLSLTTKSAAGSSFCSTPVRRAASLQSGVGYDTEEDGTEAQSSPSPSLRRASVLTSPSEELPEDWCIEGQGEWEAVGDSDMVMAGMTGGGTGNRCCKGCHVMGRYMSIPPHLYADAEQQAADDKPGLFHNATTCAVQASTWPGRRNNDGDDNEDGDDQHMDDMRRNSSGSDDHTAAGMSNNGNDYGGTQHGNEGNGDTTQRQHAVQGHHHAHAVDQGHQDHTLERSVSSSGGDSSSLQEEEDAWLAEALAAQDAEDAVEQDKAAAGYGGDKGVVEEAAVTWTGTTASAAQPPMTAVATSQYVWLQFVYGALYGSVVTCFPTPLLYRIRVLVWLLLAVLPPWLSANMSILHHEGFTQALPVLLSGIIATTCIMSLSSHSMLRSCGWWPLYGLMLVHMVMSWTQSTVMDVGKQAEMLSALFQSLWILILLTQVCGVCVVDCCCDFR